MKRAIIATWILATSTHFAHAQTDSYGWLNNERLETRYGTFEFKNGYPVGDATTRLLDMQKLNRAIEVYTTQMMRVSEIALHPMPAELHAFGLRPRETGIHPLSNNPPLELGEHAQHLKHRFAGPC